MLCCPWFVPSGCRTAPPVFSEIPPAKIEPEIATQEVRGPYVEIAGVRPGVQSEAIATVDSSTEQNERALD